jgi:hypothetical protein
MQGIRPLRSNWLQWERDKHFFQVTVWDPGCFSGNNRILTGILLCCDGFFISNYASEQRLFSSHNLLPLFFASLSPSPALSIFFVLLTFFYYY